MDARNFWRTALAGCVALSVSALSAAAATVTVSSGTVSVNDGNGWVPVGAASRFEPNSKVMAGKDSEGQIVYADGCFERVKPGMIKVIKQVSPCVGRSGAGIGDDKVKSDDGAVAAPPVDAAAAAAGAAGLAGIAPIAIVAGVAAVAGVIAVVASANDDDAPASP